MEMKFDPKKKIVSNRLWFAMRKKHKECDVIGKISKFAILLPPLEGNEVNWFKVSNKSAW